MTNAVSPELQTQIALWREKAALNTLTLDEMRQAMTALRSNRISAATASAKSLKAAGKKAPSRSADSLLGDLDSL